MTIDVEEWFQVYYLWDTIPRDHWEAFPDRLTDLTERLLDLFDETGCRVTFFTLGWVAKHRRGVVQRISERGHEIASHGLNHDLVYLMSPDKFAEETRETSARLEDITGRQVRGYRASNFSIGVKDGWALEILAEMGFSYDSSIYPVRRPRYGVPSFPDHPVVIELSSGLSIVELPPPTWRVLSHPLPVAGGGFFRFWPYRITRAAVQRINRKGSPATIYLHPWEFDPDQPRVYAGPLKTWMLNHNLHKTTERVRNLLRQEPFGFIADWMKTNHAALPKRRWDDLIKPVIEC